MVWPLGLSDLLATIILSRHNYSKAPLIYKTKAYNNSSWTLPEQKMQTKNNKYNTYVSDKWEFTPCKKMLQSLLTERMLKSGFFSSNLMIDTNGHHNIEQAAWKMSASELTRFYENKQIGQAEWLHMRALGFNWVRRLHSRGHQPQLL